MFNDLYITSIALGEGLPEDSWLSRLPVIQSLKQMERLPITKPVTFLVGENGIGKSTLIEAIAVHQGFNPEGGTVNFRFSTNDSHSELHRYLRITKGLRPRRDGFFLRAESFYNVASSIDEMDRMPSPGPRIIDSYGGVSLHKQSHGESFMALVENRFGGNGLYILDEPEAALSPMRLMELMCFIHQLEKQNSQFIISTHSPILMAYPGAEVLNLTEEGIRSVSYRETEHYQITKQFLNHPDQMCRYLFSDD
ncbi:MAG: AAA family ATPase [Oscillospiraceae bacterium]|nr:AAA family ATPase [Oscillospiraceae bacterium]